MFGGGVALGFGASTGFATIGSFSLRRNEGKIAIANARAQAVVRAKLRMPTSSAGNK
jgi:hypothetical protein